MARVPRVFCDAALEPETVVELPENPSRHVLRVLRLRPGDRVLLFNGTGLEYGGELLSPTRNHARVRIDQAGTREAPPLLQLHLVLGISRGQRMDYALQKATELGATEITPVITDRSVVRLDDTKREQRWNHWQQIIIGACEQSGRFRLPVLHRPVELGSWLATWTQGGILLDPEADQTLGALDRPSGALTLLSGPEGGLSPGERRTAIETGFRGIRLGPRILRTETAPLAAIAAAQVLWGDFS